MTRAGSLQHVSAGGMSLLVHGLLLALLFIGVSWHSLPQQPVEAELWNALPEPPAPPPLLLPVPAVTPPEIREVAQEVAKPDIALERAEKKRREAQEVREQEALQRKAEEAARLAQEQAAAQAALAKQQEQARKEKQRKLVEQEIANQAREELDAEENQLHGKLQKQQAATGRRANLIGEAKERIRSRIHSYLRPPPNLVGNPEAVFLVTLLPNGEVLRIVLQHSSGQASYDQEVERAILKASPLPLPSDRDAAAAFRDGLILKFRPHEDGAIGE